jgi:hypothetical protein
MSICWYLVCDETKEQLWCGQQDYLYIAEQKTLEMLETFLYMTRGYPLRVVLDCDNDPSEDYFELSGTYNDEGWNVWTDSGWLGVYEGTWREAVEAACESWFKREDFNGPTLTCGGRSFYYKAPKHLRDSYDNDSVRSYPDDPRG